MSSSTTARSTTRRRLSPAPLAAEAAVALTLLRSLETSLTLTSAWDGGGGGRCVCGGGGEEVGGRGAEKREGFEKEGRF